MISATYLSLHTVILRNIYLIFNTLSNSKHFRLRFKRIKKKTLHSNPALLRMVTPRSSSVS